LGDEDVPAPASKVPRIDAFEDVALPPPNPHLLTGSKDQPRTTSFYGSHVVPQASATPVAIELGMVPLVLSL
jgi:hypothetical protein